MLIFFLIWYMTGMLGIVISAYALNDKISVCDLFISALCGPIYLVLGIVMLFTKKLELENWLQVTVFDFSKKKESNDD